MWHATRSPFLHMLMWISVAGEHQYVLSFDMLRKVWGASAKTIEGPSDRPRIDLGWKFATSLAAEAACEKHAQSKLQ